MTILFADYLTDEAGKCRADILGGVVVSGERGVNALPTMICVAALLGYELTDADQTCMEIYNRGDLTVGYDEAAEWLDELAVEAEAWLNSERAAEGYVFRWYEGEFFYEPAVSIFGEAA